MATTTNAFDLLIGTGEQIAADKKKNKKSKAKPKASTDVGAPGDVTDSLVNLLVTDAPEDSGEVDVREGCAILEKSAKTCKTGTDRLKLWKDWMKQVWTPGATAHLQRSLPLAELTVCSVTGR